MKKIKFKVSSVVIGLVGLFGLGTVVLAAENTNSFLPPELLKLLGLMGPNAVCASSFLQSRVQFILIVALGGIVLVAVAYALMASFKYIRSQGEAGKMEEAQKSIKAIFIGIAAMMVAVIGIVLVFAIFGARPSNPQLLQTCISKPNGEACKVCINTGYVTGNKCAICEDKINTFCQSPQAYQYKYDIPFDGITEIQGVCD